ncbi:S-ribosylhomocysteine lyase [Salinispora tropica]|uniref:S-ribosylhomocysteine lyase n=1 Tax=Salinispora tropica (strain ATCC BAA-916 / DSM 44818 / JCM 13857 / NBRC 105044 / CNB-440) TaxID=369723 RepID=A4X2N1_SALTO|nr:S-ribosylhomocysteine lyase [Salinispora tropica]ABP53131.1 quorum-sensing autoinducer 2 (AI-2), LuxS [Salinispora tropica CNB-440]
MKQSHDLDHRHVVPPYLRIVNEQTVPGTSQPVALWDFRVAQPNVSQVPGPVMHSLEHFLGTYVRQHHSTIMNVGPMGCMTGLYVWTVGPWSFDDLAGVIAAGLRSIEDADEVPLANVIQCGWAEHHSLEGVKELAARLLAERDQWGDPGPDAHEVSTADLRELSAGR